MYLRCHSHYSLRYGTVSPENMVRFAVEQGITCMPLTDRMNITGLYEFAAECKTHEINPIAGMEFCRNGRCSFVALARNNEGLAEINQWFTQFALLGEEPPAVAPEWSFVWVIYPLARILERKTAALLRPFEFVGVSASEISRLRFLGQGLPVSRLCALHTCTFMEARDSNLHRNLRAIDLNALLPALSAEDLAHPADRYLSPSEMEIQFAAFPELIDNARKLLAQCSFDPEFRLPKNRKSFTGSPSDDRALLEKIASDGMQQRYGNRHPTAGQRVRHELGIIDQLGFAAYFLMAWDMVRYAQSRNFYHVGRGSGANSVVAYCLRITDVDPIALDLYFERFLNPKRSSPPDFDLDFSWKERDEVIDYIFKRYGRQHTALLGTVSTFKDRSIIRELGKASGLPKEEIDVLVAGGKGRRKAFDEVAQRILDLYQKMENMPNQLSIHAGGILISDKPIHYYSPLYLPPKGFPTVQWDMYSSEDLGFEKFDILSQRGIGHIRDAVGIIRRNQGVAIDVHDIPHIMEDERVATQLRSAQTIGCFYVESPAMRGLLKKLRCGDYRTLVAASSIIRPGVASSGMMRAYIERFHHPDGFSYLHPVMKEQLSETYGVMVYQEDVLKVCHHFAGLDLADADVLRRAMSGKYRSKAEFQRIVDRFFDNCQQRGYPEEITREVWRQIESFAGYSFSKAHSASFAVESFQSLFLKAWFPLEFMVAVINNFGGFYPTWVYVHEAAMCGASVWSPCINHSEMLTTIRGKDVFLGFIHVQSLEEKWIHLALEERERHGAFLSLADFVQRTGMTLEQVILLIRVGAFRFTGHSRKNLLWQMYQLRGHQAHISTNAPLFQESLYAEYSLPAFPQNAIEDAFDEIELLGFPLSLSVFDLLKTSFRGEVMAADLPNHVSKKVRMVGHFVTCKPVRTKHNHRMAFGTFLDAKGCFFDTTHFPPSLSAFPFTGHGCYLISGRVVEEFGFPSVEVDKMVRLPLCTDPRAEKKTMSVFHGVG